MRPSLSPRNAAVLVAGLVATGIGTALLLTGSVDPPGDPRPADVVHVETRALVADRPEVRAAGVLRDWDRRRAAAWAASDAPALARLYDAGSAAGRADREMLAAWSARGLRIEGLNAQVLDLRVLAHRPGRWELEVVDRVGPATVVDPTGARRPLPRDGPRTSRLVLVRRVGAWVVAGAGPGSGPAPGPGSAATATRSAAPP